ncbi:MAG: hypothetical protein IIA88_08860 [Bacteroidetes bacterium]|nr:hypothetical protein [Bacteroidota bacterium]
MKAIEFDTTAKNGIIKIPPEFSDFANSKIRIIILTKEENIEHKSKKEKLKSLFKQLEKKDIFRKIHDPVKWQKDLRNEWE